MANPAPVAAMAAAPITATGVPIRRPRGNTKQVHFQGYKVKLVEKDLLSKTFP